MSKFEILTILLSCIAIIISLLALRGQRKLQKESNDLQRSTSELAEKQLELIEKNSSPKAKLKLDLIKETRDSYKFYITNISDIVASNVDLEFFVHNENVNPLALSEVRGKLPAPKLKPRSKIDLMANLYRDGPTSFTGVMKWTNPDGEQVKEDVYASL